MAEPASPTLEARRAQTFPILAPDEIARMRRFGTPCRYAAGALILRRVALIETGTGGPVLIGAASLGDVARLGNFLRRNGIPHLLLDPASELDAQAFIDRYAPRVEDLPLVVCPDGSVLRNPTESALAKCIGMLDTASGADRVYDVAVAGAGPAGLATAVYAASEGLSVLVIDARSFGGQAGASARIENYLGFPTGISGQALAGRAYTQAQKFRASKLVPAEGVRLESLDAGTRHRPRREHVEVSDRAHRRHRQHRAAHAHRDQRVER